MIFKGSPNSLKESYFTGELRLDGVLNLGSLNSLLHRQIVLAVYYLPGLNAVIPAPLVLCICLVCITTISGCIWYIG